MERKNLLQPMITIEANDDAMYEEIEKRFPVGEDLDEKTVSGLPRTSKKAHLTF